MPWDGWRKPLPRPSTARRVARHGCRNCLFVADKIGFIYPNNTYKLLCNYSWWLAMQIGFGSEDEVFGVTKANVTEAGDGLSGLYCKPGIFAHNDEEITVSPTNSIHVQLSDSLRWTVSIGRKHLEKAGRHRIDPRHTAPPCGYGKSLLRPDRTSQP
jgi:hypothetical protein